MDNKNIEIRAITEADCLEARKVVNLVWRDAYKHIFPKEVFEDRDKKLQESAKRIENNVKNGKIFGFIAIFKNKIVGVTLGAYESEYEHYAALGYSDLQVLYILPEFQGMNIGTKFFKKITGILKNSGKNKMVICALEENFKARKVYEKWGGMLDACYTKDYVILGKSYKDVFYIYDL